MTNRKYNPNQSTKPMLIEADDDEDLAWISEFHLAQTMQNPAKCALITCGSTFEKHLGHENNLPGKHLYCSSLCAFRHKKRTMAKFGIVVR